MLSDACPEWYYSTRVYHVLSTSLTHASDLCFREPCHSSRVFYNHRCFSPGDDRDYSATVSNEQHLRRPFPMGIIEMVIASAAQWRKVIRLSRHRNPARSIDAHSFKWCWQIFVTFSLEVQKFCKEPFFLDLIRICIRMKSWQQTTE